MIIKEMNAIQLLATLMKLKDEPRNILFSFKIDDSNARYLVGGKTYEQFNPNILASAQNIQMWTSETSD
jgi:hypothetical protein